MRCLGANIEADPLAAAWLRAAGGVGILLLTPKGWEYLEGDREHLLPTVKFPFAPCGELNCSSFSPLLLRRCTCACQRRHYCPAGRRAARRSGDLFSALSLPHHRYGSLLALCIFLFALIYLPPGTKWIVMRAPPLALPPPWLVLLALLSPTVLLAY